MKEADLYYPIKDFFIKAGYEVYGEVKDVDMIIEKEGALFGIELKCAFNLKLILQAVDRQKYLDSVYVAIERPKYNKRYKEMVHLLKRLEIGLITVEFLKTKTNVVIEHHPILLQRKRNSRKNQVIKREVSNRTNLIDNIGGTRGVKRMTAYRENALLIAYVMDKYDLNVPKDIKAYTKLSKTGQILYQNYYKWFERQGKGFYALSLEGRNALKAHHELLDHFEGLLDKEPLL